MSEIVRLRYSVSLEEAQEICDDLVAKEMPIIWEVAGKKRILRKGLTFGQQTLLLLYATPDTAVPFEDLVSWIEVSNPSVYRRDVINLMHRERLIEYDSVTATVVISPKGIESAEALLAEK